MEQITELGSERYWAKCWKGTVGAGMTVGFLNLGKMRDERENQWKQQEGEERQTKIPMWVRYLGK